jgi:hypothetical protein
MNARGWIVVAVALGTGALTMRGCLSRPAPDERLARRIEMMCSIARANVETPEDGVRALGKYLDKHLGDVLGEFGDTIASIERISDDADHDDRARVARDRIRTPLRACERDWKRFADAVAADRAAMQLVENASARLSRTLEIIFQGHRFDFAELPGQLVLELR